MTAAVEAGAVPATVAAMVNGELSMMATISWKSVAALLLLGGTVTAGVVSLAVRGPAPDRPPAPAVVPSPRPRRPGPRRRRRPTAGHSSPTAGVEEGEGDSPKAWTSGRHDPRRRIPLEPRHGPHGQGEPLPEEDRPALLPHRPVVSEGGRQGDSPRLKVSAWVKAEKATKAILDAQFLDGDGKWSHAWVAYIGAKEANDPPVTHDWKRYEGVVAIPPGTKQIIIAPQIYGPGTVWFDDRRRVPARIDRELEQNSVRHPQILAKMIKERRAVGKGLHSR